MSLFCICTPILTITWYINVSKNKPIILLCDVTSAISGTLVLLYLPLQ